MQTRQQGLEGTGEIKLRDLVKESLRMRPSRVILGEVRAEECLDLLLSLNAGLPGMASLHANSAARRWSRCARCHCSRANSSRPRTASPVDGTPVVCRSTLPPGGATRF